MAMAAIIAAEHYEWCPQPVAAPLQMIADPAAGYNGALDGMAVPSKQFERVQRLKRSCLLISEGNKGSNPN